MLRKVLPQDVENILIKPLKSMIQNKKSKKVTPDWLSTEKIVALIEQAISPYAKVEHNVYLPVIGSPSGRTRQCDVVITFGEFPRETRAIVEVQKRNKKPDINTFQGWYRKMQEIGAQQLICVSALGYPSSIIEEVATRIGPTVKLLTMEQLKNANIDDFFLQGLFLIDANPKYRIQNISSLDFITDKKPFDFELEINTSVKAFSIAKESELFCMDEIICMILNNTKQIDQPPIDQLSTSCRPILISFDESHDLWLHHFDRKLKIKNWSIQLEIFYEPKQVSSIPITNFVYRQEMLDGALAWLTSSKFVYEGKENEIYIIAKPDKDGFLSISGFQSSIDLQ